MKMARIGFCTIRLSICQFIRDQSKKERIELKFVSSKNQTTNIMTKLLRMVQFEETPSPAQLEDKRRVLCVTLRELLFYF
jgi:hypothetical protein